MRVGELNTPALVVDHSGLQHNIATMGTAWPGTRLRPHVKAFKSTVLARQLASAGHTSFCGATPREIVGLAAAGLGHDLLLANETVDDERLRVLAECGGRVTVAVDSRETIEAAAAAGIREVLIDVNVGLPRCGSQLDDVARLADAARSHGTIVRGVMGYEGHLVGLEDREMRARGTAKSMAILDEAHEAVGGDIVSGGGTGTWDINTWVTELQAGSFTLMDTSYAKLDLPFGRALAVVGTVISANTSEGFAVADVGLKALGMDHGNPSVDGAAVWFCSDEHITFGGRRARVGERVLVWPSHIDPTVSQHERMHVVDGPLTDDDLDAEIVDTWPIDLRHW